MANLLLFLDMETTGLNGPGDPTPQVLEVAWCFTTEQLAPVTTVRSRLVWPAAFDAPDDVWAACHPDALAMHEASGLRAAWTVWSKAAAKASPRAGSEDDTDRAIADHIVATAAAFDEVGQITVAGSGVGPFDVPLLRLYFPTAARLVHYRPLDISSVRVMARLVGVKAPQTDVPRPHRAGPDVEWSIDEGRWWRAWLMDAAVATSIAHLP